MDLRRHLTGAGRSTIVIAMKRLAPLLICAAVLAAAAPAHADISRDDAAAIAQRSSGGGRVLAVERADAGGKPAWRVKVLTASGDVRVILLDAATGRPV
jgi:uncharacterized membrane protein YkoI